MDRSIEYILEVARCGGISKAARNLFITPSALSKFVIQKEEDLGVQIFHREGNKFTLTYPGERYVEMLKEHRKSGRAGCRTGKPSGKSCCQKGWLFLSVDPRRGPVFRKADTGQGRAQYPQVCILYSEPGRETAPQRDNCDQCAHCAVLCRAGSGNHSPSGASGPGITF